MVMSVDHPELEFVQAKSYTSGRPDGPPIWFAWHNMEASEWSGRAESTAEYFRTLPDGRSVSAHYCADDNSIIQCVRLRDTAHTAGGNPGNPLGINIELAGFARQTREEWLDPFGMAMFRRIAPVVRSDGLRYGIPHRWLTANDLRARRPGHTTHGLIGEVFGGTTHTDPGPNFPHDVMLQIVRGESAMFIFYVTGSSSGWCVSDGIRRRPLASNKTTGVRTILERAGAVNLGELAAPEGLTPDAYATVLGGALDVELGGGVAGELTVEQVHAIVRAELDVTRLAKA